MELTAKPDFERAKSAWRHFWNDDVERRPLVLAEVRSGEAPKVNWRTNRYFYAVTGQHQAYLDQIDRHLETTAYLGENIPAFSPDYGPDQFAAFLGAQLEFSEDSRQTNWVKPIVADWESFLPITLK